MLVYFSNPALHDSFYQFDYQSTMLMESAPQPPLWPRNVYAGELAAGPRLTLPHDEKARKRDRKKDRKEQHIKKWSWRA